MKVGEGINTVLLVAIVVLLGMLLWERYEGDAQAQASGAAISTIAIAGQVSATQQPLYIIDTRAQVILVYEYALNGGGLAFTAARTYRYDKEVEEFMRMPDTRFPSVSEMKMQVRKKRR